MYVSRLKALRRAACQLRKALQGFEFWKKCTCWGWRPFEGPLKGALNSPSRAFNFDTYTASETWTLEGLFWVDRPPFKGPSTSTSTLLLELEPLKGFSKRALQGPSNLTRTLLFDKIFYSVVKLISSPELYRNSKFCFEIGSSALLTGQSFFKVCEIVLLWCWLPTLRSLIKVTSL